MAQHPEVVAGPAPAVEDAEIAALAGGTGEQRSDEATKTAEPEMFTLSAGGRVEKLVHQQRIEIDSVYCRR